MEAIGLVLEAEGPTTEALMSVGRQTGERVSSFMVHFLFYLDSQRIRWNLSALLRVFVFISHLIQMPVTSRHTSQTHL
jgi:hypothetical protein